VTQALKVENGSIYIKCLLTRGAWFAFIRRSDNGYHLVIYTDPKGKQWTIHAVDDDKLTYTADFDSWEPINTQDCKKLDDICSTPEGKYISFDVSKHDHTMDKRLIDATFRAFRQSRMADIQGDDGIVKFSAEGFADGYMHTTENQ
jgi:hypothetical protein